MLTRLTLASLWPMILVACGPAPMTPQEEYETAYLGAYAPTNLCLGQELQVFLTSTRISVGETACDIASVNRAETGISDVGIGLTLANCAAEGDAIPNFSVRLLQTQAGLTYASPTNSFLLQRCTDL